MEYAGGRLLVERQKFRYGDIDVHVVGIALALRPVLIICHKLQMHAVQMEPVTLRLYETAPRVMAENLCLITGRFLFLHIVPPVFGSHAEWVRRQAHGSEVPPDRPWTGTGA